MNVDYHGHWYVHGASILLEPPHLSSSGQDANGYPPFTEGCFRVLHSPPIPGLHSQLAQQCSQDLGQNVGRSEAHP